MPIWQCDCKQFPFSFFLCSIDNSTRKKDLPPLPDTTTHSTLSAVNYICIHTVQPFSITGCGKGIGRRATGKTLLKCNSYKLYRQLYIDTH